MRDGDGALKIEALQEGERGESRSEGGDAPTADAGTAAVCIGRGWSPSNKAPDRRRMSQVNSMGVFSRVRVCIHVGTRAVLHSCIDR